MPITHATFLIAFLAIAGVPPLAGFFSKDEILAAALANGHTVIFAVALLVAALTPFYMGRIYFVTFWGPHRSEKAHRSGANQGGTAGREPRAGRQPRERQAKLGVGDTLQVREENDSTVSS
jgi:NADH:ubiquinone oxidoreductase subunit 5 (subunit L)/multisubunit Na+/H+ antiporter MnhA subunit